MRRTQLHRVMPWVGGVNTSVDPGVLDTQELVQADNVQFSTTGARIKREAFLYILNEIDPPDFKSSSGTTRTLAWTTNPIYTAVPLDERLVVGEKITVTGDSNYAVSVATVLSVDTTPGNQKITYTGDTTFSQSSTAAAGIVVARASAVIMDVDYWHFNGTTNTQQLIYATEDFQLFQVDGSGNRAQILGQGQTSAVTVTAASSITGGDYFLLNGPNGVTNYYVWYKKAGVGTDPAIAGRTGIEVDIGASDADTVVAADTVSAFSGNPDFTASAVGAVVTIVAKNPGITDETVDVSTGFTFSTTAFGATNPVSSVDTIRPNVFNERLQIYFSGTGNFPIIYNPEESPFYRLMGTNFAGEGLSMPDASFAFNFLSRVWTNEKGSDNLHFCETFDETKWFGIGDSGDIPIMQGDGDPEGITNAYAYKGLIVVSKKDSRHRLVGDSPENFQVQRISSGLGNEGSMAVAVDEMDVIFMSSRGIHSQAVTDQYGETNAQYLSADIKPTFNTWEAAKRGLTQGAYIPELNSVAFAITERGQSSQNAVWLYNIDVQTPGKPRAGAWYRWPDISCTALARRFINGTHKLVFGTKDGRLIQSQTFQNFADFGTMPIPFTVKSGTIYPGNDPQVMKAFHRITMFYRPKGNFSFTVEAKIDNQLTQSFPFNQISGLDLLGETFVLGTSILGSSNTLAPFTFLMEGYGRGITLTVSQDNANEQVEIWGFTIEYEPIGLEQDVE